MTLALSRGGPVFSRLFVSRRPTNPFLTTVLAALCAYPTWLGFRWAVLRATWTLPAGAAGSCQVSGPSGACWAVIHERFRFILFGAYPFDQHWRAALVSAAFVLLYGMTARRRSVTRALVAAWIAVPLAAVVLLRGGVAGLVGVPSDLWGGLPLTFVLSSVGFTAAFPWALALALGRRSQMPAVRVLSAGYIEIVRGVPMVTMLFMATVMFPLFVPQSMTMDKLVRAQIAMVMVVGAYLAEVIRAGLQAVPAGQYEAAASLGLSFWPATRLVVLPQALRMVIPALVNTFISFFKDTSLVAVIGLFDLLGSAKTTIADPKWLGSGVEVYLFVGAIYFVFCFVASHYSRRLERALDATINHTTTNSQ